MATEVKTRHQQHSNGKTNGFVRLKNGSKTDGNFNQIRESDWKEDFWESFEEIPLSAAIWTYVGYVVLIVVGHIRDLLQSLGLEKIKSITEPKIPGFVPLYQSFESFYVRWMYRRFRDRFNRPVASCPGVEMVILEQHTKDYWNFELSGRKLDVLNFGSYNYLGFAENTGPCVEAVEKTVHKYGNATCASRQGLGYTDLHKELDTLVAQYVGVEAAITVPMGFATNSMNMPCLMGKGCLIISDELNHSSLILGSRLSGAVIRTYKHNNMEDLEQKLRTAVIEGHHRTRRAWKKILIVVEGVYRSGTSMIMSLAYQCKSCVEPYINSKARMKTHVYKYHLPLEKAPFYCGLCLFRCESRRELQRHVISYALHRQRVADYSRSDPSFDDKRFLHKSASPHVVGDDDFLCLNVVYKPQQRQHSKPEYIPTPIAVLNAESGVKLPVNTTSTTVISSTPAVMAPQPTPARSVCATPTSPATSTIVTSVVMAPVEPTSPVVTNTTVSTLPKSPVLSRELQEALDLYSAEDWINHQPILSMPYTIEDFLAENQSSAQSEVFHHDSPAPEPSPKPVAIVQECKEDHFQFDPEANESPIGSPVQSISAPSPAPSSSSSSSCSSSSSSCSTTCADYCKELLEEVRKLSAIVVEHTSTIKKMESVWNKMENTLHQQHRMIRDLRDNQENRPRRRERSRSPLRPKRNSRYNN